MDTTQPKKLRGLFVIATDTMFSDKHPLWPIIEGFRSQLEEIHLVVFVTEKLFTQQQRMHTDGQLSVYHIRRHWLLFNLPYIWADLQFNLKWRKVFRPDFAMSFADSVPALIGYLLSWRNKKKFFMQGSAHLLGQSKQSLRFRINKFLMRHATAVIVPGIQTASLFTEVFAIPPAQMMPLEPSFDISTLAHNKVVFDFHADHAQYNFFISSAIYTIKDIHTLISIHDIVRTKYPRTAVIVLVEKALYEKVQHIIKRTKAFGIFPYIQDDSLITHINGTHAYLAVSKEQDLDTTMITALALQVPVVTRAYGVAPELFNGSQYESFMVKEDSIKALADAVIRLIEDQRLRTEYGLNTGTLLSKVKFISSATYADNMYKLIAEIVQPPLLPLHPVADLSPVENSTE